MPDSSLWLLVLIIILAVGFGVVNGFNDAANAIAASVGSRALSPRKAIILAAIANMAGAATGTAVAMTIGKGILVSEVIPQHLEYVPVMAGLASVIVWGSIATYLGLPVSITHGFVAGLAAAGIALAGSGAVMWGCNTADYISGGYSPCFGFYRWLCVDDCSILGISAQCSD